MVIINKITQYIHDAIYIENSIINTIFSFINNIRAIHFVMAEVIFYLIGILLNWLWPFPHFHLFQGIFMFIFSVVFFSLKWYEKTFLDIKKLQEGDRILIEEYQTIYKIRRSRINIILPFIGGVFLAFKLYYL